MNSSIEVSLVAFLL